MKEKIISYSYSASIWEQNNRSDHSRDGGKLLAMAASYPETAITPANRSAQLRNMRQNLQDLPAAQKEVLQLEKLFEGQFLTGAWSNEKIFKDTASEFGVIHLAMHALLNKKHPILSSLAFTENGDSLEDNFLQAYEIAHLHLDAQLVVLSACETGYGKFQEGEGVMSLARSFMYAGVPSLVVSMWEVNDMSTALIMTDFYRNLSRGMTKAEALQKAKLKYVESGTEFAAHPAFWAAFIQIGDYHPIKIRTKADKQRGYLLLIGLALLLAAPIGYLIWRRSK